MRARWTSADCNFKWRRSLPRQIKKLQEFTTFAGVRDTIDGWMAPSGPRATVVAASGGLYRLSGGALETVIDGVTGRLWSGGESASA